MQIICHECIGKETAKSTPPQSTIFDHIRWRLDHYDYRLLEEIQFISRLAAKKSPTGARYAVCSEAYLAKKVHLTRANVSRHISKLASLGILSVTHRRRARGRWQTNLYKIVNWMWWPIGKLMRSLRPKWHQIRNAFAKNPAQPPPQDKGIASPCAANSTHNNLYERDNNPPLSEKAQAFVNGILERWRSRATDPKSDIPI